MTFQPASSHSHRAAPDALIVHLLLYFPNPKAPYLLKLDREDFDKKIRCKFHFLGMVSPFDVLHDFRWIFVPEEL